MQSETKSGLYEYDRVENNSNYFISNNEKLYKHNIIKINSNYDSPLKLMCGHTFCSKCLEAWAKAALDQQQERHKSSLEAYGLLESELACDSDNQVAEELVSGDRCEVCLMKCQNDDDLVQCEG